MVTETPQRDAFPDLRAWIRAFPALSVTPPPFVPALTPQQLFVNWLTHAVADGIAEPHAMTLSTVDADGAPDSRTLLLKDVTDDGWWFSGDDRSPKGRQLATAPAAALNVYWREHGRQVRIRGAVRAGDADVSARDFRERSVLARAVASTGRQSEVLTDPAEYDRLVQDRLADLTADPDRVSPHWVSWCVVPDTVEFWQADSGRRHLRYRYRRENTGWIAEELFP